MDVVRFVEISFLYTAVKSNLCIRLKIRFF